LIQPFLLQLLNSGCKLFFLGTIHQHGFCEKMIFAQNLSISP
jgi:hypothetical protein